jgi:hypothetical protein
LFKGFFLYHWSESKLPSLLTLKTTLEIPAAEIQVPNVVAVKSMSNSGAEGKPE